MTRRSEGRDRLTHELPITVVRIGVDERRADLICRHIEGEEREHAPHLVKGDCGRAVDVEAEEEVFEEDEAADIVGVASGWLGHRGFDLACRRVVPTPIVGLDLGDEPGERK